MLFIVDSLDLDNTQLKIFEELYSTHYSDLFYFAKSILKSEHKAEEATQEAFIKIIEKIRSGELDLSSCNKARNFMVTIVKNKSKTVVAKENCSQMEDIEEYKEFITDPAADFSNIFEAKENVIRWLRLLSEEDREFLILRIFYNWSFNEIAIAKDMNGNTARSRFFRAKNKLAKLMIEEGELDGTK